MSRFDECISAALDEGTIGEAEAEALRETWAKHGRRRRAEGMSGGDADAAAARDTFEDLEKARARRAKLDRLNAEKARQIVRELNRFRNGSGYSDAMEYLQAKIEYLGQGSGLESSVEGRRKAIIGQAHAMMEQTLWHFRQGFLGRRIHAADLRNVVREAFGEDTGDEAAKNLARAWGDTAEMMRQRFNAAGGDIGRLENWGLPQMHDPAAFRRFIRKHGRGELVARLKRDLDVSRMTDRDGRAFTDETLDEALNAVVDNVLTNGWISREPSRQAFGKGMLANQRQEERFLIFRDADTWMAWQRDFGAGDPFGAMMGHVSMMARDIAAMEVLGPNPAATLTWLEQIAKQEAARRDLGRAALVPDQVKEGDAAKHADKKISRARNMWLHYTGAVNVPDGERFASISASTRNWITASTLGGAALAAMPTDPIYAAMSRAFAGTGHINAMKAWLGRFRQRNRRDAVRMGLIMEGAMNVMGEQARYAGLFGGKAWSMHLSSQVLEVSGLSPWTRAGRASFQMGALFDLADASGNAFADLDPALRGSLERYGFTADGWDRVRRVPLTEDGQVNPMALDADLRDQLLEFLHQESEYAVPSGSLRSRSLLIGDSQAGTIAGEFRRSAAMFMSFSAIMPILHGYRIVQMVRRGEAARGAGYALALMLTASLGGALALQLKQLAAGRDPRDMATPEFWQASALQGGGIGIWGDFFFAETSRFGSSLPMTAGGPEIEVLNRVNRLTKGNIEKFLRGEDVNLMADLIDNGRRYTPGGNIWYLRLAWERLAMDQLQAMAEPDAAAAFRRKEVYYRNNYGQDYWWRPGHAAPDRAPAIDEALAGSGGGVP